MTDKARCAGCGAEQPYGRIRCLACGLPLVFPAAEDVKPRPSSMRAVFVCPRCGMNSYNPNDFRERYCVRCHVFVDDLLNQPADLAPQPLPPPLARR